MQDDITRRVFITGLGHVSAGLALALLAGCDLDELIETIRNRPIRRRLRTGSAEVDADITTYRNAVSAMKGLAASDQRSWDNQAAIHGIASGFKFCQHGTQHFFDWHRAYLFHFEKICQKLTGNSTFGLPYWNWNQNPAIHSAFLDSSSPLFLARSRTTMSSHPAEPTGSDALNIIFSDTNFFTFSSQLEGTPHNSVHTWIGGTMGGFQSARDPLFWMHHCMVDYCWAKWNLELENDNTNDPTWLNTEYTHFVDDAGTPATTKTTATILMPLLAYQYESSAIGEHPLELWAATKSAHQTLEARLTRGADVKFEIKRRVPVATKAALTLARPFNQLSNATVESLGPSVTDVNAAEKTFVSVAFASLPRSSDFTVKVFVNLPTASRETPRADPHYAGSFAFFGNRQDQGGTAAQPRFLVNITPALRALTRRGQIRLGDPISLQLVAEPYAGKFEALDTELVLDQLEIIVTPVTIVSR